MFKKFSNLISKINFSLGYLAGLGIFIMGILVFFEVISRYIFNSPTVWSQEISAYLFIWSMFIGAAYTLQRGRHIYVDLLINKLVKSKRSIIRLITNTACLLFTIFVCEQGYNMVISSIKYKKFSPTPLHIPMVIPKLAVLFGFVFLMLQFVKNIIDEFRLIKIVKKNNK